MTEKENILKTRRIFRNFLKIKNFTKLEKDLLKDLKSQLVVTYNGVLNHYYQLKDLQNDIWDKSIDIKDKNGIVSEFYNELEDESQKVVKSLLDEIEYVHTHNIIEAHEYVFSQKQGILDYLNSLTPYHKYKLPIPMYDQSVYHYKHGLIYLPEKSLRYLNNKDFLDGGAYLGDSALVFEKYYHPKSIHAFEPVPENYNYMLKTIELNNLKKVIPINKGLGEKETKLRFNSVGALSSITNDENDIEVDVTSIDDYVKDKDLDVGLIKLDVEGHEINVLKGAKNVINEFQPVLSISIYHHAEQLIKTLKCVKDINSNYNIIIRKLKEFTFISEAFLIAWPKL